MKPHEMLTPKLVYIAATAAILTAATLLFIFLFHFETVIAKSHCEAGFDDGVQVPDKWVVYVKRQTLLGDPEIVHFEISHDEWEMVQAHPQTTS